MKRLLLSLVLLVVTSSVSEAGPIRNWFANRRAHHANKPSCSSAALPAIGGCTNGKCPLR